MLKSQLNKEQSPSMTKVQRMSKKRKLSVSSGSEAGDGVSNARHNLRAPRDVRPSWDCQGDRSVFLFRTPAEQQHFSFDAQCLQQLAPSWKRELEDRQRQALQKPNARRGCTVIQELNIVVFEVRTSPDMLKALTAFFRNGSLPDYLKHISKVGLLANLWNYGFSIKCPLLQNSALKILYGVIIKCNTSNWEPLTELTDVIRKSSKHEVRPLIELGKNTLRSLGVATLWTNHDDSTRRRILYALEMTTGDKTKKKIRRSRIGKFMVLDPASGVNGATKATSTNVSSDNEASDNVTRQAAKEGSVQNQISSAVPEPELAATRPSRRLGIINPSTSPIPDRVRRHWGFLSPEPKNQSKSG